MPLLVFTFCLLFCSQISPYFEGPSQIIIWNVGQGQWVTIVTANSCQHFDMGGEFFNASKLKYYCAQKNNYLYFTHSDFDHIGFYRRFKKLISSSFLCLPPPNLKKNHYLNKLPHTNCPTKSVIYTSFNNFKSTNNNGNIFLIDHLFIPGDISKKVEKKWIKNFSIHSNKIKIIILAHHGSSTSSAEELVSKLTKLQLAIGSSRFQRYGHPHHKTRQLLQKQKTPLLTTESWGTIIIEH